MAYWDRDVPKEDLLAILEKRLETSYDVTLPKLYVRLMETYSWYKLLSIVPEIQINELLNSQYIEKLRFESLKQGYKNVSTILHKLSVPTSR